MSWVPPAQKVSERADIDTHLRGALGADVRILPRNVAASAAVASSNEVTEGSHDFR